MQRGQHTLKYWLDQLVFVTSVHKVTERDVLYKKYKYFVPVPGIQNWDGHIYGSDRHAAAFQASSSSFN